MPHNPVDWYPWGPEAFAKAKAEEEADLPFDRIQLVLLVPRHGARSLLKDPQIARVMNEKFVCIKVDRRRRPDIDQIYWLRCGPSATAAGRCRCFLTRSGRPFLRPEPTSRPRIGDRIRVSDRACRGGRGPGQDERPRIEESADRLTGTGARRSIAKSNDKKRPFDPCPRSSRAASNSLEQFDPEYGGFGFNPENARRPKFPSR